MSNHHPLYVGLLYPVPDGAKVAGKPRWRAGVTHSSVYMFHYGGEWEAAVDKEISQLDLSLSTPLTGWGAEAGISLSAYNSSEGFLDGFVRYYHGRTGASFYKGQESAPDYRFIDLVYHRGEKIVEGERGMAPGDATVWLKAALMESESRAVSIQALVQAPTGDAGRGTGSGDFEYALRLLASQRTDWGAIHAGAGAVYPGALKTSAEDVRLDLFYTGFLCAVYRAGARVELVAQTMFNTSPMRTADIYEFRAEWVELTLGARYIPGGGRSVTLGFSENLNRTGPDFSVHLSVGN